MLIVRFLHWSSVVSAVLMIVLAVARGVPLLHLLAPPDTIQGEQTVWRVGVPLALLMGVGAYFMNEQPGRLLMCTAWALLLAYLWWAVAWHLRERR
jgi:hypothetical protein